MNLLFHGGFSATPPGWGTVLRGSGGIAGAQPPANIWQPSGLTTVSRRTHATASHTNRLDTNRLDVVPFDANRFDLGRFVYRGAVREISPVCCRPEPVLYRGAVREISPVCCHPEPVLYREAVAEISRGLSEATPPDTVPQIYCTPEGC